MKAMVIVRNEEGRRMELQETSIPKPRPDELLIKVKVAALNRADLFRVQGTYAVAIRSDMPEIVGSEVSGIVTDMGKNVTGYAVGDRIMGTCVGGYAEFTTINRDLAISIPNKMSWEEAAAVPISFMTEHNAIITQGRLNAGESVLVNGASSGVGVAAVQIAKLRGAKPLIVMSGSPAKLEALKKLAPDLAINYKEEDFKDVVMAATDGKGVDLIIDHIGGPDLKNNLKCMAIKGRLISVGRLGGITGELNMDLLALKRLEIIGVTFRTRTMAERVAIVRKMTADLLPALADGRLKPVIDRVFPLEKAVEAHEYMSSNDQFGKIILSVSP